MTVSSSAKEPKMSNAVRMATRGTSKWTNRTRQRSGGMRWRAAIRRRIFTRWLWMQVIKKLIKSKVN